MRRIVVVGLVGALLGACTGGADEPRTSSYPTPEPARGGTLRLALVGDLWGQLDPQMEYSGLSWEFLRCCLVRTLFSYNGRPAADGGTEARPDLAARPPEVSADGLTWTIRLKPGLRYAPPLEDVEITATDVVRALKREASPSGVYTAYPTYYSIIEGFDAYRAGDAETITGLETPDEHTLVVRLTEPAGDLPYRLALAAAAPIPPNPYRPADELGAAQGHDEGYGRYLVASGPYMIEGSEALELSLPPEEQEPIAGYSPSEQGETPGEVLSPGWLTLVRNPSWEAATDDLRAAYPDRIEVELRGEWYQGSHASRAELLAAVEQGSIDLVPDFTYTPTQLRRLPGDPAMQGRVTTMPTGGVYFLTINVAAPPFDDVHVRRAVALAIDEARLERDLRDDFVGASSVATHLAPDDIEGNLLAGYDPYPTSLEAARGEMALSGYDSDGDGACDAPECRDVLALVEVTSLASAGAEEVAGTLEAIGLDLRTDPVSFLQFYRRIGDERDQIPLAMGWNWAQDYPNASTFLAVMFASSGIRTTASGNVSLLGATPSQLRRWGYEVTSVPSADDRIERCMAMSGLDQTECWADLDRYLLEEVVPVVPFAATEYTHVVSERVSSSSSSSATSELALDRIALVPGSE